MTKESIKEKLYNAVKSSPNIADNSEFVFSRLMTGLTEAINTCFWLHKDLLRRTL